MGTRNLEHRTAITLTGVACLSLLLLLTVIGSGTCAQCLPNWRFFGFGLMPASSCKKFLMCFRGRLSRELSCPPRTAFDPQRRTCSFAAFEACEAQENGVVLQTMPLTCPKTQEETFYPDYSRGCPDQHYFRCKDGILSGMTCSNGLVFDEGVDECVSSSDVACAKDGPVCTRPSGVYANYTSGGCPATEFFICTGKGSAMSFTCPPGLFYNGALKNCDYKDNIVCSAHVRYRIANNQITD